MRRVTVLALSILSIFATTVLASAPARSPRPAPRADGPETAPPRRIVTVPVFYHTGTRPRPRPGASHAAPAPQPILAAAAVSPLAVRRSLRPARRPAVVPVMAIFPKRVAVQAPGGGGLCGDPAIQGQVIPPVRGRIKGCGILKPVKVSAVDGVRLSQRAVMDCNTARALKRWVRRGLKPAVGRRGGGVAELRVVAHYACRTRNSKRGAKISEHGKGRAIDIAGFRLRDGYEYSVLTGWHNRREAPVLREAHRAACGPFGTVLGPNADRHHQDHFHFDTARYRSGSYCR